MILYGLATWCEPRRKPGLLKHTKDKILQKNMTSVLLTLHMKKEISETLMFFNFDHPKCVG